LAAGSVEQSAAYLAAYLDVQLVDGSEQLLAAWMVAKLESLSVGWSVEMKVEMSVV